MSLQSSVQTGWLHPLRRAGLQVVKRWPWPVSARLRTGRSLYVDLRSSIGRGLFMTGAFDPAVFEALAPALSSGATFVDVGANVGYYSIRALDTVGATGAVHAFEVDERSLRCLRRTVRAGGIANLHVHEVAVSDEDGTALLITTEEAGHSQVARSGDGRRVPTTTLDSWQRATGVTGIAAIKIDVEGGELRVLRGAIETLRRDHPLVVCEVVDENLRAMGDGTEELLALLHGAGYQTRWLDGVWTPTLAAW